MSADDRRRTFAVPQKMVLTSDGSGRPFETVDEYVPAWLTEYAASHILYTITCWKRAAFTEAEMVIYIPLHWVETYRRHEYRDAKLFGVPLRLNEYASEPQVAVSVRERPAA